MVCIYNFREIFISRACGLLAKTEIEKRGGRLSRLASLDHLNFHPSYIYIYLSFSLSLSLSLSRPEQKNNIYKKAELYKKAVLYIKR